MCENYQFILLLSFDSLVLKQEIKTLKTFKQRKLNSMFECIIDDLALGNSHYFIYSTYRQYEYRKLELKSNHWLIYKCVYNTYMF